MIFPRVSRLFPPDAVVTRNEWPVFCPLVRMACCKCCCGNVDCEEGQEGKCCCGGVEGTCCQVGEYCCDGVCQEGPCCEENEDCPEGKECIDGACVEIACSGECESDEDCGEDCVCVEGECVPEGTCCFKDVISTYSFTFLGYSGATSGYWTGMGSEYLQYFCTSDALVCGSVVGDGVFFRFFDGTDNWEGLLPGNALNYPCGAGASLAGTYTLTNCTTSATSGLTIT
jgi:hypothetical protein